MIDTIPLEESSACSSAASSLTTPTPVPMLTTAPPSKVVISFPDDRMDRKNAALYLGLAEKTLAMHACRGSGPPYVKRGRVFYYREDLDKWLREGRVVSSAQALGLATKSAKAPAKMKTVESGKRRNRLGDDAASHEPDRSVRPTTQPTANPNIGVDTPSTAGDDPLPSPRASWRERLKAKRNVVVDKEAK